MKVPIAKLAGRSIGDDHKVAANDELLARIEQLFGDRVAVLR